MATDRRLAKIRAVIERRQPDLTVVLENIHDPHNVSAILRTCDAVGIDAVSLLYYIEAFPSVGRKSSASASKWVQREKHTSVAACYTALRARGFKIYTTHIDDTSVSLYDVDLTAPVAIVFGNEHRGVSDDAVKFADGNIVIPQVGMLQSLNVSVSAAVTLYEAFRQRSAVGAYSDMKFTQREFEERLADATKARR